MITYDKNNTKEMNEMPTRIFQPKITVDFHTTLEGKKKYLYTAEFDNESEYLNYIEELKSAKT